jgi:hypothetical protein
MLSYFLREVLSTLALDYVVLQIHSIFVKDTLLYKSYLRILSL